MKKVIRILQETLGTPSPGHPQGWAGFYGGLPVTPQASWPYRTQTAEAVWKAVTELIPKHPEMNETELLRMAIEQTGVQAVDLAPEDWRLLEMAIEWRKNGIKSIKLPRIGGMPGGPFNQSTDQGYGRELAARGAP